jgi:DNA-binding NarL/FixJ family response regulator
VTTKRVVIAEDSGLLREGLVRLLELSGWEVVATVGDGAGLVEAIEAHRPDVAVVDVRMPPDFTDEGLRAAIEARRRVPGTPIMMLSQYVEVSYADELIASGPGGVGYLLKDRVADVDEFIEGLERVASGGTVLDPQVVTQLLVARRNPVGRLTPREGDVLKLMAEGRTNTAIAAQLRISEGAVEKHISSIFVKLDLAPSESDHRRVIAVLAYLRSSS